MLLLLLLLLLLMMMMMMMMMMMIFNISYMFDYRSLLLIMGHC